MEPSYAETLYLHLLESHQRNENEPIDAIRDFRLVFEQVFRHLTEGEPQVFSNLFQRMVFVIDKYGLSPALRDEMHGFRLMANKVTHQENASVDNRLYLTALKAVCTTIHTFSQLPVPADLASIYEIFPDLSFTARVYKQLEQVALVKCVVKSKGEIEQRPDGKAFFLLNCEDEGEIGSFRMIVKVDDKNLFKRLHRLITRYITLNLINIYKSQYQSNAYESGNDTQIVLEPDFLIDASEIAECFQRYDSNFLLFFLGKLVESDAGESAFKGKLINDLLDTLIKSPEKSLDSVFQEAVETNALQVARFGNESMARMRQDIRLSHYKNLLATSRGLAGRNVRIEPTFFSSLYGLQGRLDALSEDPTNESRKDIFELKSAARVPGSGTWKNHQMQVVCYNMLLHSTFGASRLGTSSILYSNAEADPLRNVASTIFDEWQVLDVRNHIVAGLLNLAEKRYGILDLINRNTFGEVPPYKLNDISTFENAYHRTSKLEQSYYRQMLSFCLKELQTAKIGSDLNSGREDNGFSALWQDSLQEKINKYNVLGELRLIEFNKTLNVMRLRMEDKDLSHNFREGDLGIIYPKIDTVPDPLKSQILKGFIKSIKGDEVVFALRNKQIDVHYFNRYATWIIEHDLFESNTWSVVQNLLNFLKSPQRLKDLVLGIAEPEFYDRPDISVKDLTKNQEALLNKALKAKDYFLMQGPPGTGKTSTMVVQITKEITRSKDQRIVILAYTNRAVDEICGKLRKDGLEFLRLGGTNSNDDEALHNLVAGKTADQIRDLITGYRILVSTVSSFHNRKSDLFSIIPFDIVMIDEASQLTEPMVVGLLAGFRKFILIGDQKQLPAVIIQSDKSCTVNDTLLNVAGIKDFRQSLFERLYQRCQVSGWDQACGMLESHYRMHDKIAGLINDYYGGQLVSMKEGQQKLDLDDEYDPRSTDPIEVLLSRSRTLFIQSGYLPTSKRHEEEAKKVVAILKALKRKFNAGFSAETVGVVTPWRAQIAQIRNLIDDEELLDKVTIDTIERFQGSERKIIIVSLAIYHQSQLRALQSVDLNDTVDRKLLVTLSRAKDQIIILGYDKPLENSRYYRDLMEKIRANNGMVSYLEGMRVFDQQ